MRRIAARRCPQKRPFFGWLLIILTAGSLFGCGYDFSTGTSTTTVSPDLNIMISVTTTSTIVPGGGLDDGTPEPDPVNLCPNLELEIDFHQSQSMQLEGVSLENTINASGSIPLWVDLSANPPHVSGSGELSISGGGHSGNCSFIRSGTLTYQLEGEIVLGGDGTYQLHLDGQRSMNVTSNPLCGGMASTPLEDLQEQVLRYEEGEKEEWSWSVPAIGVEGSSQWVLHIKCQE